MTKLLAQSFALAVSFSIAVCSPTMAKDSTELLRDDYVSAKHPTRKAMRGHWKIAAGMASVKIGDQSFDVQDDRIAQQKKIAKLGFSFGELAIRKFDLDAI